MSWKFYTKNGEMIEKTVEATGAMIATGSYVGDGTLSKSITGVGFRPKFVRIWKHPLDATVNMVYEKLDQSWGDCATRHHSLGTGWSTPYNQDSHINSLNEDGFTVDDNGANENPNANGITYDWIALGFGVGSVGTALMKTGTYTGDGATSQAITGVGFQPRMVRLWEHNTAGGYRPTWDRTDHFQDDRAFQHVDTGNHGFFVSRLRSFESDGFTVGDAGTNLDPNLNGQVYDYVAWGTT